MEQFSLEKYLENPSRKVVTERNKEVRIICTDINCAYPIIAAIKINDDRETPLSYDINGKCAFYEGNDLFFVDEEEKPVSENLEDAAYHFCMDEYGNPKESLFEFDQRCFIAGAEWQKQKSMQDFLEKACEWWKYIFEDRDTTVIEDFKQYMQK